MQLDLPQDMKEEILEKAKMENLRTKIYLMVITLDLNLIENNEDYENPTHEDNGIENNEGYENNREFENMDDE